MTNDEQLGQELVVDFSEAASFELMEKGWYSTQVAEAKAGTSQAGNAKVSLMLEVVGAEKSDDIGRKLFDDLVLEGKGAWKTRQAFEAFFGATEERMRVSTAALIGCTADVYLVQKVWREEDGGDGEPRNRISKYRPSKLSEDEGAALESMFA